MNLVAQKALSDAADWYARLRANVVEPGVHAEFQRWLAADPEHRLAYADLCATGFALEQFAPGQFDPRPASTPRLRWRGGMARAWWSGLALAVLVVLAWPGLHAWLRLSSSDLHSRLGEPMVFRGEDGSVIELAPATALDLDFDAGHRDLVLRQGSAFFKVAHDRSRPFRVRAGDLQAIALGTRFDLRQRADGRLSVSVEEGRVRVEVGGLDQAHELSAGETLSYAGGRVERHASTPADLAWTRGMLVFESSPLASVVQELADNAGIPVQWLARPDAARSVSLAVPREQAYQALVALMAREGLRHQRVPGSALWIY